MTRYAAGWNMPGYAPNPDDVWVQDDFQEAVMYLREQVDHWWDGDYMGPDYTGSEGEVIDARYLNAQAAFVAATAAPFQTVTYNDKGEIDYVLWITETEGGDDDE